MVGGVHSAGFGRVRAMLYLYTAKSGGSLSLALAPPGSRKRSGDERLVLKSALLQGNEEVPQHPPLYYQERSSRVNLASSLSLLSPTSQPDVTREGGSNGSLEATNKLSRHGLC